MHGRSFCTNISQGRTPGHLSSISLALVFLAMGIIVNSLFEDETYFHRDARKFEKALHKKNAY